MRLKCDLNSPKYLRPFLLAQEGIVGSNYLKQRLDKCRLEIRSKTVKWVTTCLSKLLQHVVTATEV